MILKRSWGGEVRNLSVLVEAAAEHFPEARWQRCIVHFYRNIFSHVPRGKVHAVARMLKAIHASEDLDAARDKAQAVVTKLRELRLGKAAERVAARLRHVASTKWGTRRYLKMELLNEPQDVDAAIA